MIDRQILQIVAKNIKKARLEANITQECLAELVGVHWQTISYLENGRFPIGIASFARICQALDISPETVLEGIPEPDTESVARIKKALTRKRRPKGPLESLPVPPKED